MPTTVELGQATKHRYPGSYDNVDDAALGEMMKKRYPGSYDRFQSMPKSDWRNTAVDAMPMVGGIGGSIAGAAAGAALTAEAGGVGAPFVAPIGAGIAGGLAAKMQPGARKLLGLPAAPDSMQVDPIEVAKQQMEFSATGELLGPAAALAARVPMAIALRANPAIAATALKEGIMPTLAGLKMLQRKIGLSDAAAQKLTETASRGRKAVGLAELAQESGLTADEIGQLTRGEPIVGRAGKPGLWYKTRDISSYVLKNMAEKQVGNPEGLPDQIIRWTNNWEKAQPQRMSATEAWAQKKFADKAAKAIYDVPKGVVIPPLQQLKAQWYKNIADTWRAVLHNDIPGLTQVDAQTQKLAQLEQAMVPVVPQTGRMTHGMELAKTIATRTAPIGIGGAAGAYIDPNHAQGFMIGSLGGAALSNPLIMAQLAHGINSKILRQILLRGTQVAGSYGSLPGDQVAQ